LKSGTLCTPDGFLNTICHEVGVRELIRDGYLCPLISKAGKSKANTKGLHVRGGEFIADEVESLMDDAVLVKAACAEIVEQTNGRNACLIFSAGIQHGRHIVSGLSDEHDVECGFVCGETPIEERDETLRRFKAGELKYLCNVNVLTTGFDAPHIDCVALVRPTMSPGLYYQMVGRGFRIHPSKQNCLVLDFGGNVLRHGPVDAIQVTTNKRPGGEAPAKECPECQAVVAAGYSTCPLCGFVFPPPDRQQHDPKASEAGVLSGQVTDTEYDVIDTVYRIHRKRDAEDDAPRCLRVDYMIGLNHWQSEFICIEHSGYARRKAESWWRERCLDPCPTTAKEALDLADAGLLASAERITIRSIAGEKYDRILRHELGEIPNAALEEAPF
jgi:DNA repair protein RadD